MKIAYLSNSVVPSTDANSIQVIRMSEAMLINGHQVTLYCLAGNNYNTCIKSYYGISKPVNIVGYTPPLIVTNRLFLGARMAASAKWRQHDLVYGRLLPGCYFSAILGLPTVFEMHNALDDDNTWGRRLFRGLCNSPNLKRIVVVTHALKEWLINVYGLQNCDIQVAPDGATLSAEPGNRKISLPGQGSLHVGYVGHLYPGKGAEIIANLAARCPWADFQVIGGTAEQLARCADLFGRLPNIHLHGFVPPADTHLYRSACDVLIAPYMSTVTASGGADIGRWMSPLKIFEYMASGKPVVATDLPVLREVLLHGSNALLCRELVIEDWVNALAALRDSVELRAQLGKAAYEDFCANYSWKQRALRVLS